MNPKTFPDMNAPSASDLLELYRHAMDRAFEIEKASFDTAVYMQSCMIDAARNLSCSSPALDNLFDLAARAFLSCIEMQMAWLATMATYADPTGMPHPATPAHKPAGSAHHRPHPAAEGLEHSMDIAIGTRAA